jgi:hypothetical protein
MNPDANPPEWVDVQRLHEVLGAVHDQIATALWLSAGMVLALGAITGIALGCRRAALIAGFLYSTTLCFVHNGHAQLLGPLGCAVALTGFLWPQRRSPWRMPRAAAPRPVAQETMPTQPGAAAIRHDRRPR